MERAFEFFGVAFGAGRAQLGATMQTGVVVRADVVGGNARDDERVRAKVVDVVVTDFRDVLFAACVLPGFRSEERRVGKECFSTFIYPLSLYHFKIKTIL